MHLNGGFLNKIIRENAFSYTPILENIRLNLNKTLDQVLILETLLHQLHLIKETMIYRIINMMKYFAYFISWFYIIAVSFSSLKQIPIIELLKNTLIYDNFTDFIEIIFISSNCSIFYDVYFWLAYIIFMYYNIQKFFVLMFKKETERTKLTHLLVILLSYDTNKIRQLKIKLLNIFYSSVNKNSLVYLNLISVIITYGLLFLFFYKNNLFIVTLPLYLICIINISFQILLELDLLNGKNIYLKESFCAFFLRK